MSGGVLCVETIVAGFNAYKTVWLRCADEENQCLVIVEENAYLEGNLVMGDGTLASNHHRSITTCISENQFVAKSEQYMLFSSLHVSNLRRWKRAVVGILTIACSCAMRSSSAPDSSGCGLSGGTPFILIASADIVAAC